MLFAHQITKKIKTKVLLCLTVIFLSLPSLATAITTNNNPIAKNEITIEQVLKFSNIERSEEGLKNLKISSKLNSIAINKLNDMIVNNYFEHTSPEGKSLKNFLKEANYKYIFAGENLAINYYNNQEVVDAWMDSPTHRTNMLNAYFTEIGSASGYAVIDEKIQYITVLIFGRPMST